MEKIIYYVIFVIKLKWERERERWGKIEIQLNS
jgi:hypothetical protein